MVSVTLSPILTFGNALLPRRPQDSTQVGGVLICVETRRSKRTLPYLYPTTPPRSPPPFVSPPPFLYGERYGPRLASSVGRPGVVTAAGHRQRVVERCLESSRVQLRRRLCRST